MPNRQTCLQLHMLLECDFDTGTLLWRPRGSGWFPGSPKLRMSRCIAWNNQWAGKVALNTLNKKTGYRFGTLLQWPEYAHRVIWCMYYGEWPIEVDHRDGNKSNNCIKNMRNGTHAENMKNVKRRGDNTSGATGIWWDNRRSKWIAEILVNGRKIYIGQFDTVRDAEASRIPYEIDNGFTSSHGRR